MSFLAPLFLIGAAGIAVPIILHLIRRQTKGQQDFSSLLFLDPSPPTLMRRSRIDQWFLLLLRGLALLLLATAFARPYWRAADSNAELADNVRRAILIDTSASMGRDGLWPTAIETIQEIVEASPPLDSLALYAFDNRLRTLISHEDSRSTPPSERPQKVLAALKELRPVPRGTNLGLALAAVGDQIVQETDEEGQTPISEIILVSDFQAGAPIDRLENYQWPTQCKLTIRRLDPKKSGNVSANILASKEEGLASATTESSTTVSPDRDDPKAAADEMVMVRLSNFGGSNATKVSLRWTDAAGLPVNDQPPIEVEVPANGNRVVRIPRIASEAVRLYLEGDAATFDNERYLAKPPKRNFELVCIDQQGRDAAQSLAFFLKQLPLGDDTREVQFVWRAPGSEEAWPDRSSVPLIVASHDLSKADAGKFSQFIQAGGHGLWVLDQSLEDSVQRAKVETLWQRLTGEMPPALHEFKDGKDAMFEAIDFTHPLFRSLSDSRFNDFTKIRFWQHRCVSIDADSPWKIIARFDDAFPAIAYRPMGEGMLWLFTAGWQPSESQLALSSKFVPILSGIFASASPVERGLDAILAGDHVDCLEGERWLDTAGVPLKREVKNEDEDYVVLDEPGFYQLEREASRRWVAANLPLDESDTRVMEIEKLERLGVVTSEAVPEQRALARQEQLRGEDLEGHQRFWRWFVIGMIGIIAVETVFSARGQQSK